MESKLTCLLGRRVDLKILYDLSPYFRDEVMSQAQIIHAYFDVDHDVIWKTIKNDLHNLQREVENALFQLKRPVS